MKHTTKSTYDYLSNLLMSFSFCHYYQTQGGTQHIHIQSKKFSGYPKISLQLHCNPKMSAHFILRSRYMNLKYLETMQLQVRIDFVQIIYQRNGYSVLIPNFFLLKQPSFDRHMEQRHRQAFVFKCKY